MSPSNSCNRSRRKRRRKKKSTEGDEGSTSPSVAPPAAGTGPPFEPEEEARARKGTAGDEEGEAQTLAWLAEAFESASLDDVNSALREARGDAFTAAEILHRLGECPPREGQRRPQQQLPKKKKVPVASTGIVADVIGKGYARGGSSGGPKGVESVKNKELTEARIREGKEEFLLSMLGESCELDASIIKDVLGSYDYDMEMALEKLLDMSTCFQKQLNGFRGDFHGLENPQHLDLQQEFFLSDTNNNLDNCIFMDSTSESSYSSSEKEHEFPTSFSYGCRPNTNKNDRSEDCSIMDSRQGLQQKVLESLFSIPGCSEHEPQHMNWKKVVKKLESFGQAIEFCPEPAERALAEKADSYHVFRNVARRHWDTMRSYYQRAGNAYSKGEHAQAACFSEQGRNFNKLARNADEKASLDIFQARNKKIQNITTIDLHGQHVKQATDLVKLHLLISTFSPSNQLLKVITGSGAQGMGKVKQSVIRLLNREGLQWKEDNPGTLVIKIDAFREYSFVKSDEGSDGN